MLATVNVYLIYLNSRQIVRFRLIKPIKYCCLVFVYYSYIIQKAPISTTIYFLDTFFKGNCQSTTKLPEFHPKVTDNLGFPRVTLVKRSTRML